MTSTRAPLRITVTGRGWPIASANMSRCRSWAVATSWPPAVSSRSPGAEPRPVRRAAGHHRRDAQAGGAAAELRPPHRRHRRGHHHDAEVGAAHPPVAHQGRHDPPGRRVHRDGEPEPGPGHRRVDADHPGLGVGEGAAGVTGVERRVRLDDVLDQAVLAHRQRPAEGAHHARGDRAGQPEGVADGDDELPDPQLVRLTELGGLRRRAGRADHRQVGQRVRAHHLERGRGAVGEGRGTRPPHARRRARW